MTKLKLKSKASNSPLSNPERSCDSSGGDPRVIENGGCEINENRATKKVLMEVSQTIEYPASVSHYGA